MNLNVWAKDLFCRQFLLIAIGLGIGQARVCAAATDDAGNPYSVIVERNVFHLNPPPPPPEAEKPKVELPVVKITGFLNVAGRREVLFVSTPIKGKGDKVYYSLTEGQASPDNKLVLVKIHPSEDAVDVVNDGTSATLTVKEDANPTGTGPPAAPAPPVVANQPPVPGANPAIPGPGNPMMSRPLFGNRFNPGMRH